MSRTRLVLAECNPAMLAMSIDLLSEEFEVAATVQSGSAALEQIAVLHPDILIIEVGMHDMTGFEVATRLRRTDHHTKVVYFSLHDGSDFVDAAFANGASAYVFKSQANADLVRAIRRVARGGTFRSSLEGHPVTSDQA